MTDLAPAPTLYCYYNDVGRVSWEENLTSYHPTGDCDGRLMHVRFHDVLDGLCERHYLQLHMAGVRLLVAYPSDTDAGGSDVG